MNISKIDNKTKQDSCPLCKYGDIFQVGKLAYSKKTNFSTHEIELAYPPELWKCKRCQSCFVQYTVEPEIAKALYSSGNAGSRWSSIGFDQDKTSEVTDFMREIFKGKGSVLDVGCNTGELLDFARELGCITAGVEFSAASRDILANKGHAAYPTLDASPGKYDIITAFDLVEHLYDVPAFMKSCSDKLSENGLLVVLTGNIGCLSARLSKAKWWYAQFPEHIVFPSKKYFVNDSGFILGNWFPCYASNAFKYSLITLCFEGIKRVLRRRAYTGLPSWFFDHVVIVLRKSSSYKHSRFFKSTNISR